MDDYSLASLNDSKNEWCARLINVLTPHFTSGIQSIYNESISICQKNKENNKYLMTFQNFLSRIPHWNNNIIESECERIVESTDCTYLEDMITCIHIIQLKMLSCMRVSHINKKIDVKVPSLEKFVHAVYINIARKVYDNIYLFEDKVEPIVRQKNLHEIELIVRESIINTVRDNIPVSELLRIFLDESEEHDIVTETRTIEEPEIKQDSESKNDLDFKENSELDFKEKLDSNLDTEVKLNSEPEPFINNIIKSNDTPGIPVNSDIKNIENNINEPIETSNTIKFANIVERQDVNGKVDTQPLDGEPKPLSNDSEETSLKIHSDSEVDTNLDIEEILL